jgi:hypothetical protein
MEKVYIVNLIGQISISEIHAIDTFNDVEAMPDAKKRYTVTRAFQIRFKYVRGDGANQQKRQNRKKSGKPKTDLFKKRPSVGFRFIGKRSVSVSVSVSRRALVMTHDRLPPLTVSELFNNFLLSF